MKRFPFVNQGVQAPEPMRKSVGFPAMSPSGSEPSQHVGTINPTNSNASYDDASGNFIGYIGVPGSDTAGRDVIMPQLLHEIIPFIRQESYLRQFLREIPMSTLQVNIPKLVQGTNVYSVNEAAVAPLTAAATSTITLVAQKFMNVMTLSSELTEDNLIPLMPALREDIARGFALAEEESFLLGDPTTFSGTNHVRANLTGISEYTVYDASGVADGSGVNNAAPSIDADGAPLSIEHINEAIRHLNWYGRNPAHLLGIMSLKELQTLRGDPTILTTLERFGPSVPFLTGEIGKIYGMSSVATNLLDAENATAINNATGETLYKQTAWDTTSSSETRGARTYGPSSGDAVTTTEMFIINRAAYLIGDRRNFALKASDIPLMHADQILITATERVAFAAPFRRAAIKIFNIGE